jgi:hypothetical protein
MAQAISKTKDDPKFRSDEGREAAGTMGSMADKAREAASNVADKADDAAASVGGGMRSLAGSIREKAPHEGMVGSASSGVARALESSGRYLEQEGITGMAEDVTDVIKRNPLPAVLIAFGAGFLLAQAFTSRR